MCACVLVCVCVDVGVWLFTEYGIHRVDVNVTHYYVMLVFGIDSYCTVLLP